jgi:hypothetical protein
MAQYTEAELQIVSFDAEDVITTSFDDDGNEIL